MGNEKEEKNYNPELKNTFEMHMGFSNLHNDYYFDKEKRVDTRTKFHGNPRTKIKK